MTDRRRRNRELTREERELWAHVTRHDRRLRVETVALGEFESAVAEEPPQPQPVQPAAAPVASSNGAPAAQLVVKAPEKARPATPQPPPIASFEPRRARLLSRDRLTIDARLDLHGMRQADAHSALRRFLHHCQSEGHRHALIITGKGSRNSAAEDEFWTAGERGVLRRLVPRWLGEADCRSLVVSFTEAGPRHGGSGALYVTIRRRDRAPR